MAAPSSSKPLLTPEQGLRRTIVLSLVLHLAVLALFAGDFLPRRKVDDRPVYVVDLLNLPVKDPQAGRPDAAKERPKTPEKTPEPPAAAPPEPVKPPPKAPEPPKPEAAKPAKPPEVAKPVPSKQPQPKPAPAKETAAKEQATDSVAQAIAKLEADKAKKDLLDKLAALSAKDSRGSGTDAPIGMPDGKGKEAGTDQKAWLEKFLTDEWALSKYQVSRRDVEAIVELDFNANGRLVNYRFIKTSGDDRFDDSVRKAVLKLNAITLPNPPEKPMKETITFNLKKLLMD